MFSNGASVGQNNYWNRYHNKIIVGIDIRWKWKVKAVCLRWHMYKPAKLYCTLSNPMVEEGQQRQQWWTNLSRGNVGCITCQ